MLYGGFFLKDFPCIYQVLFRGYGKALPFLHLFLNRKDQKQDVPAFFSHQKSIVCGPEHTKWFLPELQSCDPEAVAYTFLCRLSNKVQAQEL